MRGRKYIDLAEAKAQIARISKSLDGELLLIGGIAVNFYNLTRRSQDIDLVCSDEVANKIVEDCFDNADWKRNEENNDEYRPSIILEHKHNDDYPIIKFGPKITERGAYKNLDWKKLKNDSKPFKYKGQVYENIRVPSAEALCHTKLVSFIGREIAYADKIRNDLKDVRELSNLEHFRLDVFLSFIYRHKIQRLITAKFQDRLIEVDGKFESGNLWKVINLFAPKSVKQHTFHKTHSKQPNLKRADKEGSVKLVAFDLDGTLIKGLRHSWTIIWNYYENGEDAKKQKREIQEHRKEKFRTNQISYLDWCKLDEIDLKNYGATKGDFEQIARTSGVSLTNNFYEGVKKLKDCGIKLAIISGGVDAILYELIPDADDVFDEIFINRLVFSEGGKIEKVSATEYDWDDSKRGVAGKNRGLERICEKYNISMQDAAFVGDDDNDMAAMKAAGLKVFYCGEQRMFVKDTNIPADITIHDNDLLKVVDYILNPPVGEQVV